jgi:hypothetical protein
MKAHDHDATLISRFLSPVLIATILLCGRVLLAGSERYDHKAAPPSITQGEPWHFTIAAPGWMAGMDGTIGIRGINADIDVGFDEILEHLDMIFAARAEAQKGPFGIYGEVIYIGLSDHVEINRLISSIDEEVDLTLVDGALSWRLVNKPRGSLDFAAGTHYTNVYERLTLNSDPVAIHQASERFVDDVADDLRDRLNADISKSEFISALEDSIRSVIVRRITDRLEDHQRRPDIPIGPLGGRIRSRIANLVEDFIELKLDALRVRIDALRLRGEARRAAVRRIVNAAKARIANQLAASLDAKLDQTLSRDDYWLDPYIGLRGRYNFNKTFYTAARGEIGGFGAGADLMWEVETVVGINLTRSIFTEIGYRALGGDFEEEDFLFDTVMHGPQITTGISF